MRTITRRSVLALVAGALLVAASPRAEAQRVIFLVRHAEKVDASEDAALSPAGHARAARLASLLRDAGVSALYATQLQRTRQTLLPLADLRKLRVEQRPVADSRGLVAELQKRHGNDVVAIAGHSTTLPEILGLLGHGTPISIGEQEYDALFVIVPQKGAPPVVTRLRY